MRIDRIERHNVYENLSNLEYEACRNKIETYYIYTILFEPNKNNGKYIVLCGDCAKKLKITLDKKVEELL